ncbi:MAG TPA: sulfite exporter TauE/SafE family protein [Stellaceae bacterium]|jgi:hypothetical protein|nr:sulfite exporter TauE/SafE family protein [Stellaceae bacterium]
MNATLLKKKPSIAFPAAVLAIAVIGFGAAIGGTSTGCVHAVRLVLAVSPVQGGPSLAGMLFIAAVLFCAGVVSGLAGFAFSAIAACVLWLLPPLEAMPLIMLLSTCNQLLSIGKLRREIVLIGSAEREGALPYIIGGLAGVPAGVALLRGLPVSWFAAGLGLFLISYSIFMLVVPGRAHITWSGWRPASVVGAVGGVIGGFSGFGAAAPVVYLGLRNADKSAVRGITQPYIVAMQLVSLGVLAAVDPAIFNGFFWLLWAVTLPAVLLGTNTGVALYRRLSDHNFRRAVLVLLILSGMSLVAKALI